MNKPILIAVAVLVGVLVVPRAVRGWNNMSDRQYLQRGIDRLHLPQPLGGGTTETKAELRNKVLITHYTLEAAFETDDATRNEFVAMIKKTACTDGAPLEFMNRGYSLDRTYDFPTPHGPGQFNVLITPADCGIRK